MLQNVQGIHKEIVVRQYNRCHLIMWCKLGAMIGSFADKLKTMETKCLCSNEGIQIVTRHKIFIECFRVDLMDDDT